MEYLYIISFYFKNMNLNFIVIYLKLIITFNNLKRLGQCILIKNTSKSCLLLNLFLSMYVAHAIIITPTLFVVESRANAFS